MVQVSRLWRSRCSTARFATVNLPPPQPVTKRDPEVQAACDKYQDNPPKEVADRLRGLVDWIEENMPRIAAAQDADAIERVLSSRHRRELLATGETARERTAATSCDLTPQEAQVARLAADGRTNPDIGSELFISSRTVEYHLSKVYTKFGISSRRELRRGSWEPTPWRGEESALKRQGIGSAAGPDDPLDVAQHGGLATFLRRHLAEPLFGEVRPDPGVVRMLPQRRQDGLGQLEDPEHSGDPGVVLPGGPGEGPDAAVALLPHHLPIPLGALPGRLGVHQVLVGPPLAGVHGPAAVRAPGRVAADQGPAAVPVDCEIVVD